MIDRAHRIGKGYTVAKTKKKSQKGPQRSVTEQQYAGQEKALKKEQKCILTPQKEGISYIWKRKNLRQIMILFCRQ